MDLFDPAVNTCFRVQPQWAFGLDEALFAQRKPEKGLITKAEVRVLSLAKLRLFPGAVTWDIGAVSIWAPMPSASRSL